MIDALERLRATLADRYRIEREIGAGGMATVHLAEDLKHKRRVALKVLKPELAAVLGADRFIQEITTTASLQHPHILPLFDSGTADGFLFYVMPYIQGETLRDKLNRETQLGVDEAVRIAREVADALEYAHRQGVIHRDIKPENILLHDGRPMVADFGIALAVSAAAGGRMTETGLSLGTPHYMSPEQATAEKEITGRSDVYSLASVLYEMLAGNPPHTGSSAQQIIMKIIADTPRPVTELRKSVPPNVAAAVAMALEKLPADRFGSAAEFSAALQNPAFVASAAGAAATRTAVSRRTVTVLATTTVLCAAVAGWALLRPAPEVDRTPVRFTVPVPTGHLMLQDETPDLALSPDGRTLVYATAGKLYKRSLSSESSEPLPGTELANHPFFSPDGQSIAFNQGDDIRKMAISGGPITRVTSASILGAAWGEDGNIVHTTRGALWRTPASGGTPERITTIVQGESEHLWPQMVDGHHIVIFTAIGNTGLWSDARVVALDLARNRRIVVREQATFGRFIPPNHVVYVDGNGTVSAIQFDIDRLAPVGDPFPVESGVQVAWWGGAASLAVSRAGAVAFVRGSTYKSDLLWWVDRTGRRRQLGQAVSFANVRISPDQRRVLIDIPTPTAIDVWTLDAVTGVPDRVTFAQPGTVTYESPLWSPDGERIAYATQLGDSMRIDLLTLGGSQPVRVLTPHHHHHLMDWSLDGNWLLLEEGHPERKSDLVAIKTDSTHQRVAVAETPAQEVPGRFSPDGKWVVYQSSESGRDEVYVVSFPSTGTRHQVSAGGGRHPRWSRSGELFYWQDSTLMAVRVTTAAGFHRETPRPLFSMTDADPAFGRWDVSADGQRFLIAGRNPDAPAREINVVLNWSATLRAPDRK